ncbi:ATP-binding protein [Phenylobacterium deserti]|nr:winged helix-turn-helix domain-containing protein [Phenylobacterium deserti]
MAELSGYRFGPFELRQGRLLADGEAVPLGSRALAVLEVLVEHAGEIVSHRELMARVWPNTTVEEANLRVHMTAVRRALSQDPKGEAFVENIPGRGYRFSSVEGGRGEPPTPRAATPEVLRLPAALTPMIGREANVADVAEQLQHRRLLVIVGAGGMGKTTLALGAARLAAAGFRHGACLVELAAATDAGSVATAVAAGLGLGITSDDMLPGVLAGLESKHLLLVLDNCERVVDAAAVFVETVLRTAPGVTILATSREALRAEGEWTYRLPPLAFPEQAEGEPGDRLRSYPAVQLFLERASAQAAADVQDPDLPVIGSLCRRLDGIPLAIEFAAATCGVVELEVLEREIGQRLDLLAQGRRTALPRHQTLRATLDWSYETLAEDEREVLQTLGVFCTRFTLEEAEALVAATGSPSRPTRDTLRRLIDTSLLATDTAEPADGQPRRFHRLLDTTRTYALDKLRASGRSDGVLAERGRLLCLRLREVAAAGDHAAMMACSRLMDDVRFVLDWAFADPQRAVFAVELTAAAIPFWLRLSLLTDNQRFLDLALASVDFPSCEPRQRCAVHMVSGMADYVSNGLTRAAVGHFVQARELACGMGDKATELLLTWVLQGLSGNAGDYTAAMQYAREYGERLPPRPEPLYVARRHRLLGRALHDLGRHGEAQAHLLEALSRPREAFPKIIITGYDVDQWCAARATYARVLWVTGRPDEAIDTAESCLDELLWLNHPYTSSWTLAINLCPVMIWSGQLDAARRYVEILTASSKQTFALWHHWGLRYRAVLDRLEGNPAAPAELRPAPRSVRMPALDELFATLLPPEDPSAAFQRFSDNDEVWFAPEMHRSRGAARLRGGGPGAVAEAEQAFRHALALSERQGALGWGLRAAASLAELLAASDRRTEAHASLHRLLERVDATSLTNDVVHARALLEQLRASGTDGSRLRSDACDHG